ncbi:MAG: sigma-70 family RNA polymerase sigma factor [Bacteroidia bacterium]|nr:sigma-70 family RNA polymerase sigma factor [Bacteroidia bacterium]
MQFNNLTDYELINQFISGDERQIEVLINRHKKKVFTYIILNIKNRQAAEDIFQETFIKVINSLRTGHYKDEGRFVSWVVRISHNLIIDYFRKEKHLQTVSSDNDNINILNSKKYAVGNAEESLINYQITKDIRKLIEFLPDDQKEIVILRHYVGMSFKEIAEQTNVSINTALGRMRYAVLNMRKMIQEKNLNLTII